MQQYDPINTRTPKAAAARVENIENQFVMRNLEVSYYHALIALKKSKSLALSAFIIMLMLLALNEAKAQCGYNDNSLFLTFDASSMNINQNYGSSCYFEGQYMRLTNVKAGDAFMSTNCGGIWNDRIVVYREGSPTPIAYNDNQGPDCNASTGSLAWIAPQDGSYRVLINYTNCVSYTDCVPFYTRKEYSWDGSAGGRGSAGCGSNNTYNNGSGTYRYFTLNNGLSYTFSACNFNNHLTIYRSISGKWIPIAYDQGNCSSVTFNAPATSTNYIAVINRVGWHTPYNTVQYPYPATSSSNANNGSGDGRFMRHDFAGGSAVLSVRENRGAQGVESGGGTQCGGSRSLSVSGSAGTGYTWHWVEGGAPTTSLGTGNSYSATSTGTYYARRLSSTNCWGDLGGGVAVTINPIPGNPTNPNGDTRCGSGTVSLSASPGSNGNQVRWYASSSGGSVLYTGNTYSPSVSSSGSYWVATRNSSTGCEGTSRVQIFYTVNAVPAVPTSLSGDTRCGSGTVNLSAAAGSGGNQVRWYANSTGGSVLTTGTSYTPSVSSSGSYYVSTYNSGTGCESGRVAVSYTVNGIPNTPGSLSGDTRCGSGTVNLSASAGSGGNQVRWYANSSGGSVLHTGTTYNPSVSSSGTYYVSTRNSGTGCESGRVAISYTVNAIPNTPGSLSGDTRCGSGTVNLSASAGSGGNQVRWYANSSGGSVLTTGTTYNPSVSSSGSYYVSTYNSSTQCESGRVAISYTVNSIPSVPTNITGDNVCGSGVVNLSASAGSGGNQVRWYAAATGGSPLTTGTTYNPSVSSSGSFYVATRNSSTGCESGRVAVNYTVYPLPPAVSVAGGGIGCNGSALLTASGGGSGNTIYFQGTNSSGISIANPGATETVTVDGTYYFRSRSPQGCWGPAGSATVDVTSQIVLTNTSTPSNCGQADGIARVSVSGGTGPYTYSWAGGNAGSPNPNEKINVTSGSYAVTVTDANSCTASGTMSVSGATGPTATITNVTDVTCNAGSNGSATVSISGGSPPYSISWSTSPTQTGLTATGLSAGGITVTVTDQANCSSTDNATVGQPSAVTATVLTITDADCNGASTGSVDLSASGGTGTLSYNWSGPGGPYNTQDLTNVPAGNYSVTVTDQQSCTFITSATVGQPTALTLSGTTDDADCNGANDGSINITAGGGTAPYAYNWTGGITTEDRSNLFAGSYSVTVTDNNGCTISGTYSVGEPTAVGVTSITITDVDCKGNSTGSITFAGTGGTPGYTYSINGTTYQVSGTFTGLAQGTYTLYAKDNNNCVGTGTATVNEPALNLAATLNGKVAADCFGASTASIDINVVGGTGPYTYLWSNSSITQDLINVAAGSYTVTVTDNNNCTTTLTESVGQATVLSATASVTNVSVCQGLSNGEIDFVGAGGSGSYEFSIDGGSNYQVSANFSGLSAGTYDAWIKDANVSGCEIQLSPVTVNQPASLAAPTLPGGNSYTSCGLIVVNAVAGGSGDLAVLYDGVPGGGGTPVDTNTAFVFNTLPAGNYTYYLTSYNSAAACEGTAYTSFDLEVTNPVLVSGVKTDVTCHGDGDGAVNITVSGGTPPYTYTWNNGASTEDLSGLSGGFYSVQVSDANGCFNIFTINVIENAPLTASVTKNTNSGFNIICNGAYAVNINVLSTGGAGGNTYDWSDGGTGAFRLDLGAGSYTVTVTDANGCTKSASVNLTEPPAINLNLYTSYQCSGGGYSSATVTAIASGGAAPYTYSINNGTPQTSNVFNNLSDGSIHTIKVFDANFCEDSVVTSIVLPAAGTAVGDCGFIYVASAVDGGDPSNVGTPDCPTTIHSAMTISDTSNRNYIKMLSGTYNYSESVYLNSGIVIEGGYERDANGLWIKSTSNNTILDFEGAYNNPTTGIGYYAGFISDGATQWYLIDINVSVQLAGASGTTDGAGRSVYGILINNGSSNYNLTRVRIQTGDASNGQDGSDGANGLNGSAGLAGGAGQFIQDNTGGTGPFPACCGGGDGGTGGNGGGPGGGIGSVDPGAGNGYGNYPCHTTGNGGNSFTRGGGGGGHGGHGGYTSGTNRYDGGYGGIGGNGGRISGLCNADADGGAVIANASPRLIWDFYTQPQPSPTPNGLPGLDGEDGSDASISYAPGNQPNSASLGEYFMAGNGVKGNDGFGGGGGSGGGGAGSAMVDGRSGGTPAFLNVIRGSGGGSGGGGGQGGEGGFGGGGGGSSFGLYVSSTSLTGANLQHVNVIGIGSPGIGGIGGQGGEGGTGGQGGQGGPEMKDLQFDVVLTGQGGSGGNGGDGGDGGRGQDGDDGVAQSIYFGGNTPPTQTPAPSVGNVTIQTVKACTNSEIVLVKTSSGNWGILNDGALVNDITGSTSSFATTDDSIHISYTSIGAKDITIGGNALNGFVLVSQTRSLPVIDNLPASICQNSTITLNTPTVGVEYLWEIADITDPTNPINTFNAQTVNNVTITSNGTFQVKLQVREECCGWSVPVYETFVVDPVPTTIPSISGPSSVCAFTNGVVFSAPVATYAAANTNTNTGYLWTIPSGATITSVGGNQGVVSGGNVSITVDFAGTSGDVTVTPSNACGDGATTTLSVAVSPTPVVSAISSASAICLGSSEVLSPVVTGGSGSFSYLWSPGGQTTPTITVSPTSQTTYSVTVTDNSGIGCASSISKTIDVFAVPGNAVSISGDNSVYYQEPGVTYTTPVVPNAATYVWTVPAGATIVSGQGTTTITVDWGNTSGNVTVTPTNNVCTGNSASIAVTVGSAPYVWQGTVSGEWFDAANWTPGIPGIGNPVLIPAGRPNYPNSYVGQAGNPVSGGMVIEAGAEVSLDPVKDMTVAGDISVNTGGTLRFLSVASSGSELHAQGELRINGTLIANFGGVVMDGSGPQVITGHSGVVYNHLDIDNANGVTVDAPIAVHGHLRLSTGTLNTNDQVTIKSDVDGTGLVDDFTTGRNGDMNGDIIVQAWVPTGSNGFHHIGSPVNTASVASELSELNLYGPNGGQVLPRPSCDPLNVDPFSPYGNLMEWREDATFTYNCNQAGWFVRSSGTLQNGRGYAGIFGSATNDVTIDISGEANTGSITYSGLDSTNGIGNGWHLVSNPYPSPIEWNAPAGFYTEAQLWQTSGYYGGTYVPVLSGTGALISSSQGFFIKASGGPHNFTMTNNDRSLGNVNITRQTSWYDHILNVELQGNGFADKTVVYFSNGPTNGFDMNHDAHKRDSKHGQPTLYTRATGYDKQVGINGLPDVNHVTEVPMGLKPGTSGTYTLTFEDISSFEATSLVFLEDLQTGTLQNLRVNNEYTFTADVNDDTERFIIHFVPAAEILTTKADCENANGSITVDLGVYSVNGTTIEWDSYSIADDMGTVLSSGNNVNGQINVPQVSGGNYTLTLDFEGYIVNQPIAVDAANPVTASYIPGFNIAYTGAITQFYNQSTGATSFEWSFGDGTTSTLEDPTHIYTQPGEYDVVLTATNGECTDTYTNTFKVSEGASGLNDPNAASINILGYQNRVTVLINNVNEPYVFLNIYDVVGRKMIDGRRLDTKQTKHIIELDDIATGYYFVTINGQEMSQDKKVFLSSDK